MIIICIILFLIIILLLVYLIRLRKSLTTLWTAIKDIDFTVASIDFSKLDTLEEKGVWIVPKLIGKYKHLSDVLCEHIINMNSILDNSSRDALTNCYNVAHLQDMVAEYEQSEQFVIIFIDVNNLKRMNDTCGHKAGDNLLISAANKLNFWSKYGDVYRVGGDEFMIVLTNIPVDRVITLLNSWYPTVGVLNRETDAFKCVLSYGIADGFCGDSFESVKKLADDRMYEMKQILKKEFGEIGR